VQVERRRQPALVGGQRGSMAGMRGRVIGRQTRVKRRHPVLEPAYLRLAYPTEPQPVVAEHHGDGVVQ